MTSKPYLSELEWLTQKLSSLEGEFRAKTGLHLYINFCLRTEPESGSHIDLIIAQVCLALSVPLADVLYNGNRSRNVVDTRHILAMVFRNMGFTYQRIAQILRYSNHTTVLNNIKRYHSLVASDPTFVRKTKRVGEVLAPLLESIQSKNE